MQKSDIKDLLRAKWKELLNRAAIDEKLTFVQNNVSVTPMIIDKLYSFITITFNLNMKAEELCELSLEKLTNVIFKKCYKPQFPKKN